MTISALKRYGQSRTPNIIEFLHGMLIRIDRCSEIGLNNLRHRVCAKSFLGYVKFLAPNMNNFLCSSSFHQIVKLESFSTTNVASFRIHE